ncbi:MAG: hypothetical protein QG608_174 [Actinomycetota bacterium]|nr:hypothetical protein [Actinomycetota bacterium]
MVFRFRHMVLLLAASLTSACTGSCSYRPLMLPVVFSLDSTGKFSVAASASMPTLIGTVSAGVEVDKSLSEDKTRVSLVHTVRGKKVKDVYDLDGRGAVVLCLNGWFSSRVERNRVDIQAMDGVSHVGIMDGDSNPADCVHLTGVPVPSPIPAAPAVPGHGYVLGPAPGVPMPLMSGTHWPNRIVGNVTTGNLVEISCTVQGDPVQSPYGTVSTLWNKVGTGYVPDSYVFTGTDQPVASQCP